MADVTRQVLIEFVTPNTSGLQSAVDQLAEMGAVEQSAAAAFKATNTEANKQAKILQDIAKSEQALANGAQPLKKSLSDIVSQVKQMGPAFQKEFQKGAADALKAAGVSADQLENALQGVNAQAKPLKAQLKEMVAELARMKVAGEDNTEQYQALAKEAGNLKDAIGDANQEVANFGSDTKNLDGAIGLAQGLTGAFASAQGAAALFGDESEELQKVLLRVNAAMAVLQGLQQIQIALQKESAAAQFVNTVATKAQAAAQLAYNVVVGASTGVLKVFRIALAATGIGLFVLAIGALVSYYQDLNDEVDDVVDALKKQKIAMDEVNDANKRAQSIREAAADSEVKAAEIREAGIIRERALIIQRNRDLKAAIDNERISNKLRNEFIQEYNDNVAKLKDLQAQQAIAEIATQKAILAERKDAAEKAEELEKQRLQSAIYRIQSELVGVREGSRQELELKKLLFQAQAKLEIFEAKNNADQILLIRRKLNNDILEMEKAFRIKQGEGVIQTEAAISSLRIRQEQQLQDDLFKTVQAGGNREVLAEQEKSRKIQELNKKAYDERKAQQLANAQLAIDFAMEAVRTLDIIFRNQADKENQRISEAKDNVEQLRAAGAITEKEAQQRLKKIEAEEKRIRKEQAEREKKLAVFNAFIAIPQAFLKGLVQGGPILGAIFAAIAGAQAALVLSRPVPKFAKGKKDSYQGLGEVGEAGAELIEKDGRMYVADRPQIIWLNKQDKVFNPAETQRMLQGSRMSTDRPITIQPAKVEKINYELFGKEVAKNIPQTGLNIDERGFTQWMRQRQSFITYLNSRRGFK